MARRPQVDTPASGDQHAGAAHEPLLELASWLLQQAQVKEGAIRNRDWREVNRLSELERLGAERLRSLGAGGIPAPALSLLQESYRQNRRNAMLLRHTLAHVRHMIELISGVATNEYGPAAETTAGVPSSVGLVDRRA